MATSVLLACALMAITLAQSNGNDLLFEAPGVSQTIEASRPRPSLIGSEIHVDTQVPPDLPDLKVAWEPPAWSHFQPEVGRFGLFPVPPLRPTFDSLAEQRPEDEERKKENEAPWSEWRSPPKIDPCARLAPCDGRDFSPDPTYDEWPYHEPVEQDVYQGKYLVPTQRPWVECGLPLYQTGPIPPSYDFLGPTNLVQPKFYVYGDYRIAFAQNKNIANEADVLAHRLNLEVDFWLTATERFHAFLGPFQDGVQFMRIEEENFEEEFNFFDDDTDTFFFEGDFGQILGGIEHTYAPFDVPITAGLIPLVFQNGVWALDAFWGAAATIPARNSPWLDWSNYDVTFFAGLDQVSSDAFAGDAHAGAIFGMTTFIEARGGYFELGYAYLDDDQDSRRSYHNLGLSYTRRYIGRVSNSLRAIVNTGQGGPQDQRTADGVLLLLENSLITSKHYRFVPYLNLFAGFRRPQPAARAAAFGGVLFNTGILFQTDALTGYPTLDPTANDVFGAALGVDLLSPELNQQLIVEAAALSVMGDPATRNAAGDQLGLGLRWQLPVTNAHLIRADAMYGRLDNARDVSGARVEFRWKF